MKRKQIDPAKAKKRKKILAIAGVAAACVGGYVGIKSLVTYSYGKGVLDSKLLLENFNYEKMKNDIKRADYDETFYQIFGCNRKVDVTDTRTGNRIYYVGENQKLDFIKKCLEKNPDLKEHLRLMITAAPGATVETF